MIKSVRICDCCGTPVGIQWYGLTLPNSKNGNKPEQVEVCEVCNNKIAILLSNMHR